MNAPIPQSSASLKPQAAVILTWVSSWITGNARKAIPDALRPERTTAQDALVHSIHRALPRGQKTTWAPRQRALIVHRIDEKPNLDLGIQVYGGWYLDIAGNIAAKGIRQDVADAVDASYLAYRDGSTASQVTDAIEGALYPLGIKFGLRAVWIPAHQLSAAEAIISAFKGSATFRKMPLEQSVEATTAALSAGLESIASRLQGAFRQFENGKEWTVEKRSKALSPLLADLESLEGIFQTNLDKVRESLSSAKFEETTANLDDIGSMLGDWL